MKPLLKLSIILVFAILALSLLPSAKAAENCGPASCGPGQTGNPGDNMCEPNCADATRCWTTGTCEAPRNCNTEGCPSNPQGCNPSSCGTVKCNSAGGNCYTDCSGCSGGSTPPPPPSSNQNPKGVFDAANCNAFEGWSCDPDDYNAALTIKFYDGDRFVGSILANRVREQAVGDECGGNRNHGFRFPVPNSLKDSSSHTITAKAVNSNNNDESTLNSNPKTISCQSAGACSSYTIQSRCDANRACCWKQTLPNGAGQCRSTPTPGCTEPICGNGILEIPEICDKGNDPTCVDCQTKCDNDGICESGETQEACPNDCFTRITINPNKIKGGERTLVTIDVRDGRYSKNDQFKLGIEIDTQFWETNLCPISGVTLNPSSPPSGVTITSNDYQVIVNAACTAPANIKFGSHTLRVTPEIFSS